MKLFVRVSILAVSALGFCLFSLGIPVLFVGKSRTLKNDYSLIMGYAAAF